MFTRHKDAASQRPREGLVSRCLLERGDVPGDAMAVTWVEIEPGGRQIPHNHPETQIYVIMAGKGTMLVGTEKKAVAAEELIHVPSGMIHGIENSGAEMLTYISAATPAFDFTEAYDRGQLVRHAYPPHSSRGISTNDSTHHA